MKRKIVIAEGLSGTNFYHLMVKGEPRAVCGERRVVPTSLGISTWGMRTHIGESYCEDCCDFTEECAERAAIREHDGGFDADKARGLAVDDVLSRRRWQLGERDS